MKNFFCTIPQQPPEKLKKTVYANPCGNPALEYSEPISFPVLAIIGSTVQQGETIRITAIKPETENCDRNAVTFSEELDALKEKKGFEYTIDIVPTPLSETIEDHQDLFGKLMDYVSDDEAVYTDITYGTKPIPIIMLMVLTYAYRFKKNLSVESIIYGLMDHDPKAKAGGKLYDVSALFYMNSTINSINTSKDPKEFIKNILAL